MSSIKKLASDTALYGVSSMLGRALNFLLVPLYTGVFPTDEYGIVTELYGYVAFFNVLFTYGMETAYFRFSTRKNLTEQTVFNTAFTSILSSSLILVLILWLIAPGLLRGLDYNTVPLSYLYWLILVIAVDAIVAIPFARLRAQSKALLFASARLLNIFLNIGLNLFFLVLCPAILKGEYEFLNFLRPIVEAVYSPTLGIGYVFLSNLIANGFYLVLLAPQLKRVQLTLSKGLLKEMLIYAYPLLLMGLAGVTNEMFSRPMLRHLLPEGFYWFENKVAVGILGGCYKLAIFMNLAIQSFRFAAEPFFFAKASDKNSPQLFSQVMHYFIIVCCLIFFAVFVNLPWFMPIFLRDPIYMEGVEIVPILLLAYLFYGIYLNLTIWFKLADKTKYGTFFTASGAVLTIVLNVVLIPTLGYLGAAIASLLVFLYMAAICYYFGQKHYPIPYRTAAGLLYILGATALAYTINGLMPDSKMLQIILGIGSVLLVTGLVFLMERRRLTQNLS